MSWPEVFGAWVANHLLAPAIVAVTFSWLLLLRVEGHRSRRDALTSQVQTVRQDLIALWELCAEYWSREPDAKDALIVERILLAEQDLRFSASEVAGQLGKELDQQTMAAFVADVTDAATSAPFGEDDRGVDLGRLSRLRIAVVVMRDSLLAARNRRLRSSELQ